MTNLKEFTKLLNVINQEHITSTINDCNQIDDNVSYQLINKMNNIIEKIFYDKASIYIQNINKIISTKSVTDIELLKHLRNETYTPYVSTRLLLRKQQMKNHIENVSRVDKEASLPIQVKRITATEAITAIKPNLALTLSFNPNVKMMGDFNLERANKTMNKFFKKLYDIFNFNGYYTFEHCSTNIHAHLALHVDDVPLVNVDEWLIKTEDIIELLWKDCIQSGAVWLSYIDKPKGWAQYIVKHIQETNEIIPTPSFDVL